MTELEQRLLAENEELKQQLASMTESVDTLNQTVQELNGRRNRDVAVLYDLHIPQEPVKEAVEIFRVSDELAKALDNSNIPAEKKENIIEKIFSEDKFPKVFTEFLKQLCENHKTKEVVNILENYCQNCEKDNHIVTARFFYVHMPEETQIEKIRKFLCKKYDAEDAEIIFEKDETLIGGFILNVDNTEFDYSIKGRIDKLKQKLAWR